MATINVFRRYEKKFLMDEAGMNRLLPEIVQHMLPDEHCRNGQTYHICNLYFDNDNNDVIRGSLEHPFYKEKLRLRSYGIPRSPEAPVFLELKKKVDGIVTKRRAKLSFWDAEAFLEHRIYPDEPDYITRQVLREVDYYLSHQPVTPRTLISYDRIAFFDRMDPQFRLTFDQNLRFSRENVTFHQPENTRPLFPDAFRLMEVKVSGAYPKWFADLLCEQQRFPHSFSKYGVSYKTYLKEEVLHEESLQVLAHI